MKKYEKFDGPCESLTNKDLTALRPGKVGSVGGMGGARKRKKPGISGETIIDDRPESEIRPFDESNENSDFSHSDGSSSENSESSKSESESESESESSGAKKSKRKGKKKMKTKKSTRSDGDSQIEARTTNSKAGKGKNSQTPVPLSASGIPYQIANPLDSSLSLPSNPNTGNGTPFFPFQTYPMSSNTPLGTAASSGPGASPSMNRNFPQMGSSFNSLSMPSFRGGFNGSNFQSNSSQFMNGNINQNNQNQNNNQNNNNQNNNNQIPMNISSQSQSHHPLSFPQNYASYILLVYEKQFPFHFSVLFAR